MDLMIIVSEIKPDKLNLFFQFFRTVRNVKLFKEFDAEDCRVMSDIYNFIKTTNNRCVKECGVSLKEEIKSEVIKAIGQRIKNESLKPCKTKIKHCLNG